MPGVEDIHEMPTGDHKAEMMGDDAAHELASGEPSENGPAKLRDETASGPDSEKPSKDDTANV